jgi:hypothetical protein
MTDFNYKKYSLEKLEEWMHDAMSCDETTPQDIFDVIKGVVEENYYHHKHHTGRAYELLALLNGNGKGHIKAYDDCVDKILSCNKDDTSPECEGAWNSFWEDDVIKEDKVTKWRLPVEVDDAAGDADPIYYVNFPDDLLEAANLKEGDKVEWVDQGDGSYLLRKV